MNFSKNASKQQKGITRSMWHTLGRKTVFVNIRPLLLVWSKKFVLTNPNITKNLLLFKHGKKNKLSEYISGRFWDSHFIDWKENFSMNFSKTYSKQQKSIVYQYVAHFVEKNIFC